MSWPLSQDYNEAIQSPATSFSDADLKKGQAVCNKLGLPMPYSGNFADVYQVRCPNGSRWAVKCFTREVPGLRERYQEISAWLGKAKLPFSVEFSYLEQGIRVRGKWYPILKMQWVEGLMLNQFVGQYLDKPAMLETLLQIWAKMGKYLRSAKIGHCDLQHGNILLVPGSTPNALALKLIDYDGMWIPPLAGKKTGEVGHANYQHPQRLRETTYSLEVDRFPLLLAATAMRALKADKSLWAKYDNGDNLLFKESDLAAPGQSPLFEELASLPDPGLVMLAAQVRAALKGRLESTALLEEAMPEPKASPVSTRPSKLVTAAAKTAPVMKSEATFAFDAAQPSTRSKRQSAAKKGLPIGLIAAALGVIVLVSGAAAAFYAMSGASPKKTEASPTAQTPPVEMVQNVAADEKQEEPPSKKTAPEPSRETEDDKQAAVETASAGVSEPSVTDADARWSGLDLGAAKIQDGVLHIAPPSGVRTKETYTGPIEIDVVARTAANDIRLDAFNGACVIFNWENKRNELRVNRPDGNEKLESGSLATAKVRPLEPNTWYVLRWIITEHGMEISVDGKVVFSESKRYDLSANRPVGIRPLGSRIEVKSFEVKPFVTKSEPKPPVPDEAALAAADKEIKDVHKADFAKKKPAELQPLAVKLLKEGIDTKDNPPARFVLLREAGNLAARLGDFPLALRSADETAKFFDADALEIKRKILEAGLRAANTPLANTRVVEAALPLAEDGVDADDFDRADRFLKIAQTASRETNVALVLGWVQARAAEIETLRKAYEPVKAALQTLASKPDDADANLTLGKYLALSKGDWNRAMPALAKGSDAKLKALALADGDFTSEPDAQLELAKNYSDLADGESGPAKAHLQRRACYWYRKAAAHLSGLSQTEAIKQITEIDKTLPHPHPAIVRAYYGTGDDWQEVTSRVWSLLFMSKGQKLSVKAGAGELGVPNHDNHQGKTLAIVYRVEGQTCLSITQEGGTAIIPALPGSQDLESVLPTPGQELLVLAARFGVEGTWFDVTAEVQHRVKGPSLAGGKPGELGLGDPARGKHKTLLVVYRYDNRTRLNATVDDQPLELGAAAEKP